ncbi:MAG: putative quinol monooxygenase [Pontimonas sp.]
MTAPTTVIVVLTPLAGRTDDVIEAMNSEIEEILRADGCELYDMFERVDGSVILIERWRDREAWQAHFETPAIMRLKDALTPLLATPAERWEMYGEGEIPLR